MIQIIEALSGLSSADNFLIPRLVYGGGKEIVKLLMSASG